MATIIICDICKNSVHVETKHYGTGNWETDLGGGRSEEDFETFDLCRLCELKVLRKVYSDNKKYPNNKKASDLDIIEDIKRRINIEKTKK